MTRIVLICPALAVMGGKQRDCIAIGAALKAAGAQVSLATFDAEAALAIGFDAIALQRRGVTNHGLLAGVAAQVTALRAERPGDIVVGFEKIPGLDFYYAADPHRPAPFGLKALLPRYRVLHRLAREALGRGSTYAFFLTERQAAEHARAFDMPRDRYEVLPPIIHARRATEAQAPADVAALRAELGIPAGLPLAIAVAVVAKTKGADLAIEAAAGIADLHLLVVGAREPAELRSLATLCGLGDRLHLLPYAEDIMPLLKSADVLVHPARTENTGTVIVEALMAGTPAIVTENCGYAGFVARSGGGVVLPRDPSPAAIAEALRQATGAEGKAAFHGAAAIAGRQLRAEAGHWLGRVVERVMAATAHD